MIAQLPVHSLPDQPPVPATPQSIQHDQRETRRLIEMSRGAFQAITGFACLVVAAISLQPWRPVPAPTVILLVPFIVLLPGMAFQYIVLRARKRAGIPKVTLRGDSLVPRHPWQFAAKLALALVLVALLTYLSVSDHPSPFNDGLRYALIALVLAVPMAWRAWRLSLWELHLMAAGFILGFGLSWATTGSHSIGWLCLALGATELLAGLSLHRRWQAWVRALPANTDSDPALANTTDDQEAST